MSIVKLALNRPYTFIVAALMLLIAAPFVLLDMSTDIFPDIDIPVVSIVWSYNGYSATDMAQRIVSVSERTLTTTVDGIEHIESQSLPGVGVIKVFFQPHANTQTAIAQAVSISQWILRSMPPGTNPPLIIRYSASSVPIVQLGISSKTLPEQTLNDLATNIIRPQLISIPGASIPFPYGGKPRVISVDLDTEALLAHDLTPNDIVNAVSAQNLLLPGGTAKMGGTEYAIDLNGSPNSINGLNDIPLKTVRGATVYMRDVAHVRDGFSPQTNIVRENGQRGVLLSIQKNGNASTLKIVEELRDKLPAIASSVPKTLKLTTLFDQSVFVRAAASGVMREGVIAAALTALMVLLFLGSWRSTLIISASIPVSILCAIIGLYALGQSFNLMTLGGLALAVGILVDNATVAIENIERHLQLNKPLKDAILDGALEIGGAALASTLCVCIVFVPMFFLRGVARYLFVPMAEAVVLATVASYLVSRTLVPTLVLYLDKTAHAAAPPANNGNPLRRIHLAFNAGFERLRRLYTEILRRLLVRRNAFVLGFLAFCVMSCALYAVLGVDFFPSVDAGQIRLHVRAPTGVRIEDTAELADQVERSIRSVVPADQLSDVLDNIGLPYSGINLAYSNAASIGTLDIEILISLKAPHKPTAELVQALRKALPQQFPGVEFFFQPADIVTQILNFGSPAAIDLQFQGRNTAANYALALALKRQLVGVPGVVDTHIQQRMDSPAVAVDVDRTRAQIMGISMKDVSQNVLVALSGSAQTTPSFWVSPANGIEYALSVQTPQYRINSVDALLRTPIPGPASAEPQLLGNVVRIAPKTEPAVVSDYNITPVFNIYTGVQGRDLGSVDSDIEDLVARTRALLPRGSSIVVRGQAQAMKTSFAALAMGLCVAVLLVYLLNVITFQSWKDALIIVAALPAALAGISWMLFLTGTTLNVPSLTGTIMTMGVATANSILLVSFARARLDAGASATAAALEAGAARIRPVLMTAGAMIIGMLPMALGLGEGAEQNAPLGRAVIGGLLFATVSTLLFVPAVFSLIHERRRTDLHPRPSMA